MLLIWPVKWLLTGIHFGGVASCFEDILSVRVTGKLMKINNRWIQKVPAGNMLKSTRALGLGWWFIFQTNNDLDRASNTPPKPRLRSPWVSVKWIKTVLSHRIPIRLKCWDIWVEEQTKFQEQDWQRLTLFPPDVVLRLQLQTPATRGHLSQPNDHFTSSYSCFIGYSSKWFSLNR